MNTDFSRFLNRTKPLTNDENGRFQLVANKIYELQMGAVGEMAETSKYILKGGNPKNVHCRLSFINQTGHPEMDVEKIKERVKNYFSFFNQTELTNFLNNYIPSINK